MVSGDYDQEEFDETMKDSSWLAIPFKSKQVAKIEKAVECPGYPHPVVINGKTGKVIEN